MSFQLTRRQMLQWAGAVWLATSGLAHAQGNPARLYVGYPPGGLADSLARVLTSLLARTSGLTMIVENKPGASGQLAVKALRQAEPDGQTLLLTTGSVLTLTPHLYRKPAYDSLNDVTPICTVCDQSFALAVAGGSPIKSVAEFIAWGKAHPTSLSFASPGAGSSPHFLGTMFGRETGLPMNHIAYKGTAPGLQDVAGGQVASTFNPLPTMLEFHRAGRIRILAVTNPKRVASLPNVPTFTELKMPSLEYTEWYGVFAPASTPEAVVARLQAALQKVTASPEMAEAAKRMEVELRFSDAPTLRRQLEVDYKRWAGIVKATGIQLDS